MRLLFLLFGLFSEVLFSAFIVGYPSEVTLKNGDLIFIVNPSGQGKAIQLATHSKYTHVGIVFIENGKIFVYHAVEPVMKSTLNEFIALSADHQFEIKRLKNQTLLTEEVISKLKNEAKKYLGKHYDLAFSWDDEQLYCSEYVWKVYNRVMEIQIGALKPLKAFDLSHPAVKKKIEERYGNKIPLDENMISPGDMFSSVLLE